MSDTTRFQPCVSGAFGGGLARAQFFDGMILSEADLMREQSYWRRKRKLTNRALGEGVVWGLVTEWNAKSRSFTVCPGYGLSCCGDDLVVECAETVTEASLIDPCSEDFRALLKDRFDKCGEKARPDEPVKAALLLEYVECPDDPRQTFSDPCGPTARHDGCRFGAMRETVRLRLVAPPEELAGPLDRFCRKIAELRAELDKAGIPAPVPDFDLLRPSSRFGLAVIDGGAVKAATSKLARLRDGEITETTAMAAVANMEQGRLFVEPPGGYIFTALRVDGVDQAGAAMTMGWSASHTADDINKGLTRRFEATVSPLFMPGSDIRLTFDLDVKPDASATHVRLNVTSAEKLPGRTDCTGLLSGDWLEGTDPFCKLRTLALALVYGAAAGKLGNTGCAADADTMTEAERKAREQVAWVLCWLGWQTLFGLDVADPRAGRAQACLKALFAEWCAGFAYRGPRCSGTAHGIYLGSVEISPKGKITCFDPWQYRRHVLTGPLLTHWGAQVGLPAPDRIAGWMGRWLCCAAGTDLLQVDAKSALADLVIVLGKGDLAMGPAFAAGGSMERFAKGSSGSSDAARFAGQLLGAMFTRSSQSIFAAEGVDLEQVQNREIALATPGYASQSAAAPATAAEAVKSEVKAMVVSAVPPMARAPMHDYVAAMAERIPLAAIRSENEAVNLEPTIAAMAKAGIVSTADLIASPPEKVADAVRAADPAAAGETVAVDRSVGLVYDRVLKMLGSAGEAIAEVARKRDPSEPFTRSDLPDAVSDVQRAANAYLKKGQGTTIAGLRAVAASTIAAR